MQTSLAEVFTVTNVNDGGAGSLRQAIADANVNQEADTITFDQTVFSTPRTILLTTGELVILREVSTQTGGELGLSIVGPGANLLTIDANNLSRIFRLDGPGISFSGMTLKHGFATRGGAIYVASVFVVELANVVITENVAAGADQVTGGFLAGAGGGIYAGGVIIRDSVISNNTARGIVIPSQTPGTGDVGTAGAGGGIFLSSSGSSVLHCEFTGNRALGASSPAAGDTATGAPGGGAFGGALYVAFGPTIANSRFSNNSAVGGDGGSGSLGGNGGVAQGGAVSGSASSVLNIAVVANSATGGGGGASANPTQAGNGGDASGGGIYERGDPAHANGTLYGNSVNGGVGRIGGKGLGGGLYQGNRRFDMMNLTITNNSAAGGVGNEANGVGRGGGAFSALEINPPSPFRNNIVAQNSALEGPDVFGFFPAASNNLIGRGEGSTGITNGVNGNLVGNGGAPIDPLLGPLALNGGVTETRALLQGSPAIDSGNNAVFNPVGGGAFGGTPLIMDQRNYPRIWPAGGAIDMGAYEFGSPNVPVGTSSPDLREASDTGASNTDNITMASAPQFMVTSAIPGARAELLRDGLVVVTVTPRTTFVILTDPAPPLDGTVNYTARQVIGSEVSAPSPPLSVTFDHTPPTSIFNQASTQADPTRLLPIVYTAVFSERVSGYSVSLAGSTADVTFAIPINTDTGDGITWRTEVFGATSNGGFVVANVSAGSYQDIAGNPGMAATSTDNQVTLDNVRPSVTINQAVGQPDPSSDQPINFAVVFSESVTGFTSIDISFAGSTANTSQAAVVVTGGPTNYSVSISNIRSSGLVRVSVPANAAQDGVGNQTLASTSIDNTVTFMLRRANFDFDGDGKTDIGIFRPLATAEWWINRSSTGQTFALQFGASTDKIAPADYTGDGKADITFFRPSSGEWYVLRSEDNSFFAFPFGANGDIPTPADYDADGKADFAVFRPSSATWFISRSGGGGTQILQFGANGDVPVVADYDGDNKADIAILRPAVSGGEWWINRSTGGSFAMQFGANTDKPVQGDYTGDGKADIAIWRPASGEWMIVRSEDFSFFAFPFGANGDVPSPGDYDGDGKFDPAVFRPSAATWYIPRSTAGTQIVQFGADGDQPIPNAFVP